jgi:hypothetical protein
VALSNLPEGMSSSSGLKAAGWPRGRVLLMWSAVVLAVFRSIYLDNVPAVLPHDAAAVLYDTIVRFLRLGLRTVLVLGLVVAAGAFLTGPSATAVRTRAGLAGAIGWGADRAGLPTGRVGAWVEANKRALRVGAVVLACLALVFWGRPTGEVVRPAAPRARSRRRPPRRSGRRARSRWPAPAASPAGPGGWPPARARRPGTARSPA